MKNQIKVFLQLIFFTALLLFAGCTDNSALGNPRAHRPKSLKGPLKIYYEIQSGPNQTSGTGTQGQKVEVIHFFETYILVESDGSGGQIFPTDKIINFRWSS